MILVALERDGANGEREMVVNPAATEVVVAGDVLVVIGPH